MSTMKCEEIEVLLVDYLDNTLDEKSKNEVDNHLAGCSRCLDSFNESKQIFDIISKHEPQIPDSSMRGSFYAMLHDEIKKQNAPAETKVVNMHARQPGTKVLLVAAGFALFIIGTFAGLFFSSLNKSNITTEKLAILQAEVDDLKKKEMFTMLGQQSTSYRLQGVGYASELVEKDDDIVGLLVNILNTDENTNVRLAAAFSLSRFTDNSMVRDSLVASLPLQNDPIVQITLINILVEIKEKSALRPIRQIADRATNVELKRAAEKGAGSLLL